MASIGFDASVWEIYPYLAAGARLYICPDEIRVFPMQLMEWVGLQGITICFMPTPLAESVIGEEWPEGSELRVLLTGGDRLRKYPSEGFKAKLVNQYGPTEATVVASSGMVRIGEDEGVAPDIGKPIANTEIYILDEYQQPVPLGVRGELYIGGEGLARGYLRRPELTAERFVPDRWSGRAGGRLYRTGDVGRYWEDGSIEFVGRADQQVKIRGYRIELGEIEGALLEHEGVREAVVEAREENGEKRLVAYLVMGSGEEVKVNEVRGYLREKLPDYMVPALYVEMEAMPLTASGKVDRRALPGPEKARTKVEGEYQGPRNAEEEVMAGIWREVLRVEVVGVEDNFFDLGGHSLLATQVMSRIREIFKVEMPLTRLFETPTIAALARAITNGVKADDGINLIATAGEDSEQEMLSKLDQLSDEEVNAMLSDMISE
jgi:acyl-coenzyme A synthetase/AMP-(fatty) acid ligase/acyl carrier protein